MVRIVKKSELKSFYEESVRNYASGREGLLEPVTGEFSGLLENYSEGDVALDIGYGFGAYTIACAMKGLKTIAVDIIAPAHLKNRITGKPYEKNVSIVKKDILKYSFTTDFSLIIAKDVLHFLSKNDLSSLLKRMALHTRNGGGHYLVLFTDIQRHFDDGEKIVLEGEASLSMQELKNIIKEICAGWKINMSSFEYVEEHHEGLEKPFTFRANKVVVIAKK